MIDFSIPWQVVGGKTVGLKYEIKLNPVQAKYVQKNAEGISYRRQIYQGYEQALTLNAKKKYQSHLPRQVALSQSASLSRHQVQVSVCGGCHKAKETKEQEASNNVSLELSTDTPLET